MLEASQIFSASTLPKTVCAALKFIELAPLSLKYIIMLNEESLLLLSLISRIRSGSFSITSKSLLTSYFFRQKHH